MTNPDLTHLVLILDRSGSMGTKGKHLEAEKGIRALVDEQKTLPGTLELTIAKFDNEYELLATSISANDFNESHLKIEPRGMTALIDAIAKTTKAVGQNLEQRSEHLRPSRVMVVVATDGMENASQSYTAAQLKNIIETQTNIYSWDFVFMGCSKESVLQAQSWGFDEGASYAVADSAVGLRSGYAAAARSISTARRYGLKTVISDEDRKDLK